MVECKDGKKRAVVMQKALQEDEMPETLMFHLKVSEEECGVSPGLLKGFTFALLKHEFPPTNMYYTIYILSL